MTRRGYILALPLALALLAMAGCGGKTKSEPVLAQAYTGPVELHLRPEIHPKSGTATVARHGQKLDVLQVRRRFVRVRTEDGKQGWTELRNLFNAEQMENLAALAKQAENLPSHGKATVYATLNIHTEPSRTSTSFAQLKEGEKADVVAHQLVPRNAKPTTDGFSIPKPKPVVRKKKKKEPKYPPPPKPGAPALPGNWQELSQKGLPPELIADVKKDEPKVPMEDWSLIRTKEGRAGWVLTRNLIMAIPDEVAQYSEGARITSYFDLGTVQDGGETKHHWLWTTMSRTGETCDFDSWRVFIWMVKRHRYETAYIDRKVEGYFPVTVTPGSPTKFSILTRAPEGELIRRTYVLEGYNVRKIAEEPWKMKPGEPGATIAGEEQEERPEEGDAETEGPSLKDRLLALFGQK